LQKRQRIEAMKRQKKHCMVGGLTSTTPTVRVVKMGERISGFGMVATIC
jgi:hypothetical protein